MLLVFLRSCIGREWNELEFGDVVSLPIMTPHDRDDDEDHEGDEQDEGEVWQPPSKLEDCCRSDYDTIVRSRGEVIEIYELCMRSLAVIHRTQEQIRTTDRLIFRLSQNLFVGADTALSSR